MDRKSPNPYRPLDMKKLALPLIALLSLSSLAFADEASHRAAAEEILEINKVPELMEQSFMSVMEPTYQGMKANGLPDAAIDEIKAAVSKWYNETMKWEIIKPKFADLYIKEFSEEEMKELVAFYKTPVGQKAITKMPTLMQQGSEIGQELATANQAALGTEIQAIMAKYKPSAAPGGAPAAPSAP